MTNFAKIQNVGSSKGVPTIVPKVGHCDLIYEFCYFLHFLSNRLTNFAEIRNVGSSKGVPTTFRNRLDNLTEIWIVGLFKVVKLILKKYFTMT